nr:TonB-dependent receptor [Gemmatimonadaceae bacterium]
VPEPARAGLEQAVIGTVGNAISRLENGNTAFILSFGNAGRATERGAEVGAAYQANDRLRIDANYTWYDFTIDQDRFAPGDTIDANAPPHAANLAASWQHPGGLRVRVGARYTDAFAFRVGTWRATLPAATALDLHARMPLRDAFTLSVSATNLLDQKRVHALGGSVVERRVLVTLGWAR